MSRHLRVLREVGRPNDLFRFTAGQPGRLAFEPGEGGRLVERRPGGGEFEIGRPQSHAARDGFPLRVFQLRSAEWWRQLLGSLSERLA